MKQFLYPYILFEDAKAAAEYYITVFGGEITYIMYGKDTPDCPEDQLERIMHLQYKLNNTEFYMADDHVHDHGRIHLHLDFEDIDELKKAYENMRKDGETLAELRDTFWGATYGVLRDKFDVTWAFHFTKEE